jgi:predicted choloylglycine hydrolase
MREIIKIRTKNEQNRVEKKMQRVNETESWFFEKIDEIDHLLTNLTKVRTEMTQINKIGNEKGEIATNVRKIQGIIRDYFENLYKNKLENLEKMDKFLDI